DKYQWGCHKGPLEVEMRSLKLQLIFFIFLQLFSCTEKVKVSGPSPNPKMAMAPAQKAGSADNPSFRIQNQADANPGEKPEPLIGVYYMPSWDFSSADGTQKDIFWACLQGKEDCPFLHNTAMWGPNGRIYNAAHPYQGPYLDRMPHKSLKG